MSRFGLSASIVLFGVLFVHGCGGGGGGDSGPGKRTPVALDPAFSSAATGRLATSSFTFPAGSGIFDRHDPRESMEARLTIGRIGSASVNTAFTIASPDGSVDGGAFFLGPGGCAFDFTYSKRAGQPAVTGIGTRDGGYFDECGVDGDGRLALLDIAGGDYMVSQAGGPVGVTMHRALSLTEGAVIDDGTPPPATGASGAVELVLTGQILNFAAGLQGIPATERLAMTIHAGTRTENTPAAITLVGAGSEPVRELHFNSFANGIAVGSVLLSQAEANALARGIVEHYVQVSSPAHPNGLLRAQVTPALLPLDAPLVLTDPTVASGSVLGPGGNTIEVISGNGNVVTLSAPRGAAGSGVSVPVIMTPVRAIIGPPLVSGTLAAVDLSPDGQRFDEPLTLTFEMAEGVNSRNLVAFSIDRATGRIAYLPLYPGAVTRNTVQVEVTHFSGVGIGTGDPGIVDLDRPPSAGYQAWRDRIKEAVLESESGQFLGSDSALATTIDQLLLQAFAETILPQINAVTDAVSFDRAFLDYKAWLRDVQALASTGYDAEQSQGARVLVEKVEAVAAALEQECFDLVDPCDRFSLLRSYANWLSRAQYLEVLSAIVANVPPYEEFCGAIATQEGADIRLTSVPSEVFTIPGVFFDFDVTATDTNGVSYPIMQEQWSMSPASANAIDPDFGVGTAAQAGVYVVQVTGSNLCAAPGVSLLNVKNLTGTWEMEKEIASVTCPEDFKSRRTYPVEFRQNGGQVRIVDPTFGPVDAMITDYTSTQTGTNPPRLGIDTGPVTTSTTFFCAEFSQDVGAALNDPACDPPNACEPVSCEETYDVSGTFDRLGNVLTAENAWSDTLAWWISSPGTGRVLVESLCSGVDRLTLIRDR